jgi:archaellum biogenesis ATPase FlaH
VKDDGWKRPTIITSAQLLARSQSRLETIGATQLWGRYVQAGSVTLLVGETSAGKTVFLHNLGYHLAEGQAFLGVAPSRPLRVLHVDFESFEEIFVEHFGAIGTSDRWHFLALEALPRGDHLVSHLRAIVQTKAYEVVIVDPLMEAYPVEDENDNPKANKQMLAFRKLARDLGPAVILVHNSGLRKEPRPGPFLARGATARADRADRVINFTKAGDRARELHVVKSRGPGLGERIRFRFAEKLGYELSTTDSGSVGASESGVMRMLDDVRKYLKAELIAERAPVRRASIMEHLAIPKDDPREQMLDRALAKGVGLKVLDRPADGAYALPSGVTAASLLREQAELAPFLGVRLTTPN